MASLPNKREGVEIVDGWNSFGQRTTNSGTTRFAGAPFAASSLVFQLRGFERPTMIGSVSQNIRAGIDLSIARAAFAETLDFLRTKSRPWIDNCVESAQDDPLTMARVGKTAIRLEAAKALVNRAGRKIDVAQAETSEEAMVEASLTVAAVKVLTTELAINASNVHFELAGTSSVKADLNLNRPWRNARTHMLHNPVRWN